MSWKYEFAYDIRGGYGEGSGGVEQALHTWIEMDILLSGYMTNLLSIHRSTGRSMCAYSPNLNAEARRWLSNTINTMPLTSCLEWRGERKGCEAHDL